MHPPTILLRIAFLLLALGLALPLLRGFQVTAGSAPDHRAILASAWVAAAYWYVGTLLLLAGRDLPAPDSTARAWWSVGWGFGLLHVAIAFHAAHGWSHAAAFEAVARTGGYGEGVYVNYLFLGVWAGDAVWAWVAPTSYSRRPRWVFWTVHGFLAFVVFNATVVFASGVARWLASVAFAALVWDLFGQNFRSHHTMKK